MLLRRGLEAAPGAMRENVSISAQAATGPRFGRGVWRAPYRVGGNEILLAIDTRRNCIGVIELAPGVDEPAAIAKLTRALDVADPAPDLRLVIEPRQPRAS